MIFTSQLRESAEGYAEVPDRMLEKARAQPGFLGVESARGEDGQGITVSYWRDLDSIRTWKADAEHREAQHRGRSAFYEKYRARIARIDEDFSP